MCPPGHITLLIYEWFCRDDQGMVAPAKPTRRRESCEQTTHGRKLPVASGGFITDRRNSASALSGGF